MGLNVRSGWCFRRDEVLFDHGLSLGRSPTISIGRACGAPVIAGLSTRAIGGTSGLS